MNAVREAIHNAVAHKDYASAPPIQISVYKDKIMIWNYGKLPEDWTMEKLTTSKHPSMPYNPDIANDFFRIGYIEAWGRGFSKMTNECIDAGLPKPLFYYDMSGYWVVFRKDIYNKEHLSEMGLNARQLDSLLFFKEKGEILSSEYRERFGIAERTARYDLAELVEKNLLIKQGSKKTTKYIFADKLPLKQ